MKKILHSFIFVAAALLSACGNTAEESRNIKVESIDFTDWDKLIEIVEAVPLEEDSACFISMADRTLLSETGLYLSDFKTKLIYSFSKEGKYLRTIGRIGHAKDEYTRVADMCLTDNGSTLAVLDARSILYYDANTGKLKKSIPNKHQDYQRFAIQDDGNILYVPNVNGTASIISEGADGRKELRERKRVPLIVNTFYKYGNACRVVSDYGEYYIDTYTDGRLQRTYTFDLGKMALPETLTTKTYEEFEKVDNEPDYFKSITQACETDNDLFVQFVGPNRTYYWMFADKASSRNVIGPSPRRSGMAIIGADGEYYYAILYPDAIDGEVFTRQIIKNMKHDAKNPVLVKIKVNHEIFS